MTARNAAYRIGHGQNRQTESESDAKEADAERMAAAMVMHMADLSREAVRGSIRDTPTYHPTIPVQLPSFLRAA